MPVSYKWRPIADFDVEPASLTDGELISLQRVWARQKQELAQDGSLAEFEARLRREWSIETGIIENVYTLDRGVTRTLIEKGIDAALIPHGASNRDSAVVARIIQDHYEALEGMFDLVGGRRELTTGYIRELHAALLRNQDTYGVVDQLGRAFEKPLEKGAYKTAPNSPTRPDGSVHEYCPPEHVASEMDRLVALHAEHERKGVPVEVEAAWLHHRFAQIHPFADGNGRVARAIASLVFIRAGWFPLIVMRDDWSRYIDTLEEADLGDMRRLVGMFVEAQRNAVIQATEIGYELRPVDSPEQAIAAIRDELEQRGAIRRDDWQPARATAERLAALAVRRFEEVATGLVREVGTQTAFRFVASDETLPGWVLEKIAKAGGLSVDARAFTAAPQFAISTPNDRLSIRVSFHGIGPRVHGLIAAVPTLETRGEPRLLSTGIFQINYEESTDSAEARFRPWLERVIVEGLNQWRRTL